MTRLPVLERAHDFNLWLVDAVAAFPHRQRYLLGERLEVAGLDLIDLLVEARLTPERRAPLLQRANVRVDRIAYVLRMAKDLGFLAQSRYEHACKVLDEVGVQIGGWLRSTRQASVPAR